MACTHVTINGFSAVICHADYFVSLEEYGAHVWLEFHHYTGPTFFRSKNAIKPIEKPSKKTWDAFSKWHDEMLQRVHNTGD